MVYAQYFHDNTGWNGKDFTGPTQLIEMIGMDGIHPLDGRKTLEHHKQEAKKHAEQLNNNLGKKVKGFKIMRGKSFSDAKPTTDLIPV